MNFGASFTGVTFFQAAPVVPVQGADNGTSLSGTNVQLGQDVGAVGDPARLLNNRVIPLNTMRLLLEDSVAGSSMQFVGQSFDIASPDPGITVGSSVSFQSVSIGVDSTNGFGQITFSVSKISQWLAGGMAIDPNSIMTDPGAGNLEIGFERVGVNTPAGSPTAKLHIGAGVAAAMGAPFKYTSGVANQTVLENGAKNFNGTNEFLTAGGVNYTMAKTLTATAALDFPNTAAQSSSDLTIALTGAADGDVVSLGVPVAALNPDSCYTAFVSAANTVTVRFNNYSAGAIDPASGTFRVSIIKY